MSWYELYSSIPYSTCTYSHPSKLIVLNKSPEVCLNGVLAGNLLTQEQDVNIIKKKKYFIRLLLIITSI
jgi:hypothetical protein